MLVEKMWAKVSGNYEVTWGGNHQESFDFFSGIPYTSYTISGTTIASSGDNAYSYIEAAVANNYPIGGVVASCGTNGDSDYNSMGLVCSHAYSILGAATVTYNGASIKLIEVRNPWSKDTWDGDYNDDKMPDSIKT